MLGEYTSGCLPGLSVVDGRGLLSGMGRWVLLRHELPDGSWHYDWMLDPGTQPDAGLVSFRVMVRVDDWAQGFDAQRLAAHRRAYLQYEGEVSDGRGRVERVAGGTCEVEVDGAVFQVVLIEARRRWVGERVEGTGAGGRYRFRPAD